MSKQKQKLEVRFSDFPKDNYYDVACSDDRLDVYNAFKENIYHPWGAFCVLTNTTLKYHDEQIIIDAFPSYKFRNDCWPNPPYREFNFIKINNNATKEKFFPLIWFSKDRWYDDPWDDVFWKDSSDDEDWGDFMPAHLKESFKLTKKIDNNVGVIDLREHWFTPPQNIIHIAYSLDLNPEIPAKDEDDYKFRPINKIIFHGYYRSYKSYRSTEEFYSDGKVITSDELKNIPYLAEDELFKMERLINIINKDRTLIPNPN